MKAKVTKRFRDRHTKKLFNVGDVFEGEKERVEELQKLGYLQKPKKQTKKEDK